MSEMSLAIPKLFVGGLSGRVFLATRWHTEDDRFVADEKYDVTDQFVAVAFELDEDWWNARSDEQAIDTEADRG